MGRPLRTSEIRRKRAEARAEARALRVGSEIAYRVPCSHGAERGCLVFLATHTDGSVMHVSSECTRKPPSEEEAAVMRSLIGETQYKSCAEVVASITAWLSAAGKSWDERRRAQNALLVSEYKQPALWHALKEARDHAVDVHNNREHHGGYSQAHVVRAMHADMEDALRRKVTSGIMLPQGWSADIATYGRWDRTGGKGQVRVHMTAHAYGNPRAVATYCGRGRFRIDPFELYSLRRDYTVDYVHPDHEGKRACTVCGRRYKSISGHVKTEKHHTNVESLVLSTLESIGQRLAHKPWRTLDTTRTSVVG